MGHRHPGENKMDAATLRATQAPIKERYKSDPKSGDDHADRARLDRERRHRLQGRDGSRPGGGWPASGGRAVRLELCSGDMLLEALVACAGVTLGSVATAIEVPLRSGNVTAEGDLDFRGTLGVDKEAPVGFAEIRLGSRSIPTRRRTSSTCC